MTDVSAPEGFEPIETAPKDGTRIVVWRPKWGLYSVQWLNDAWTVRDGKTIPADDVTHWKPSL